MRTLSLLPFLLLLLLLGLAAAYVEVVRVSGCHDSSLRLSCRNLDATMAILNVEFLTGSSNCTNGTQTHTSTIEDYVIRPSLNLRCSGKTTCNFRLIEDVPESVYWGAGNLSITYACRNGGNLSRACNADIIADKEGFLETPGYPNYYVGNKSCLWTLRAPRGLHVRLALLDVSLKGPEQSECTDVLQVTEGQNVLLSTCGEIKHQMVLLSDKDSLNVSIDIKSAPIHPKRGALFHYKAVGCIAPSPPDDGYLVYKNETHAHYMCCVGFIFPDTKERARTLHCNNENTWNSTLPQCINVMNETWGLLKMANGDNITRFQVAAAIMKESDLMFDVLLPTMIICVLLVGNGVIIYVIFHLRKRKLSHDGTEEEMGAICQPQDANPNEKGICV